MTSFGVVIPSFGAFAEAAVVAELTLLTEALGYQDVWFGDHILVPGYAAHLTPPDWLDPLASCLIALGRTTTLRAGTDVLVAPYRNPVVVAKLAASADHLSGGRLTLGFGVGYLRGEFEAVGAPPYAERGAVTDEYLEVLRLLWDGENPVSHHGRYVQFEDAWSGPRPVQVPMPIWVGGNGPRAFRRAARLGTGWHPLFPTPEAYAAGRRAILEERAEASTAGEAGSGGFTFSLSCATTQLIEAASGPYHTNTWDELGELPADFNYAPPIPTGPDGRPRFVGTPEQVADDVAAYVDAGVEHLTLRFATGASDVSPDAMARQMRWFAETVLPKAA